MAAPSIGALRGDGLGALNTISSLKTKFLSSYVAVEQQLQSFKYHFWWCFILFPRYGRFWGWINISAQGSDASQTSPKHGLG